MKTSFIIGLAASLASFAAASPAADADTQLSGRDPVLCIGCISAGHCTEQSNPPNCNVDSDDINADCIRYCFDVPAGCSCCDTPDATNCAPL